MTSSEPTTICESAKIIGSYPIAEIAEKKAALAKSGIRTFDFGPGDDPLPIDSLVFTALREKLPVTSAYPSAKGTATLRDSIAGYVQRRFQVALDDAEIIPITGSKEGIYHLPALFIDAHTKRRTVVGPALYYPPYIKGTQAVNGEYLAVQGGVQENYLLELGDLPPSVLNNVAIAYLNFPHNPTGATCTLDYYRRQIEVAHKFGFVIVSDECYADIYFGETAPPSALEVTTDRVLAFHSLSKRSGLTGFRSGFVAGDRNFVQGYAKLRNAIGTAPPEPIMIASTAAWNDDQHVVQRRLVFEGIRKYFTEFFTELGIEFLATNATFYLWAKAPGKLSGKEYAEKLQSRGIFVSPADFFGEGSRDWFRVSLVLPIEESRAAFEVWKDVHKELGL
ncbi:MAG: aminotransferase class I/II-fold pyridoxal phosphate-dependent enzyme [Bdellovibrionales bacterium]|nr:aminotransferase class I/II-fold pyridoxal phosphate-dependent enzyme [Bdellovibrionales bacterium]